MVGLSSLRPSIQAAASKLSSGNRHGLLGLQSSGFCGSGVKAKLAEEGSTKWFRQRPNSIICETVLTERLWFLSGTLMIPAKSFLGTNQPITTTLAEI
jgi:hypothetical protein